MQYGLALPNGGVDPQTMAEFAALAMRTKRVRLSTQITPLARRRPWKVAREKEVTLLPRPVQTPRIPIWIGGAYPLKGPVQRATRWDGACLYKHKTHYMLPEDVGALKAFVASRRGTAAGYDISVGGSRRRDDWDEERAYIQSLAKAGSTWWIEYVPPDDLDKMRACITRGPLRID